MEAIYPLLFHVFPFVFLLFSTQGTSYGSMEKAETNINEVGIIGAIVDSNSRIGKEERVAMEMAIEDFYTTTNRSLTLHVKNSRGEPNQAAIDAAHLINKQHVRVILGPRTWEETSLVSDIGSHSPTPILSFADSAPEWATTRWPFLIQASHPTQRTQMKAVAAIVKSCGWHRVSVIYEDTDPAASGIFPHLHTSIQEVGAEISNLVGLPPFVSDSSLLSRELEKVKTGQCRVIVVHASLPLALGLFKQAKNMGMMEPGYVWITTDTITSLVHALSSSAIFSMQGVIGVKSYFRESGERFNDFYTRFARKFHAKNLEERNHEPGIFALQAYDLMMAVALAVAKGHKEGRELLDEILSSDYAGLSGEIQFSKRKLAPAPTFQLVNVIGKSYKEIGFWSDGLGFSRTIDGTPFYEDSMENLWQVIWPGEPRLTPKGWTQPTSGRTMRIAVPKGTLFNNYVRVGYDPITNNYTFGGFSVEVFKLTITHLPYALPYDLILFDGTWDDMLDQVHLKNFDAAIGSITMTFERYKRVDFSQPHADTALVMVVPFTKAMWVLTALINVYNGFVIWTIEREHCHELRGSAPNQIGTLLWLAFATLFSLNGGKLHSNLSRMAMLVWLFVAMVITQSYTANLTSMLTVSRLIPTVVDIETLKYNNAMIGCSKNTFVSNYLVHVLKFSPDNMKTYTNPEQIAEALRKKEIAAAFMESPGAKFFVEKYCKSFIRAGPTYQNGGYAFAFQKGSPVLSDINKGMLQVIENGDLRKLEESLITTGNCVDVESEYDDHLSLSPNSFGVLFTLTGGTSTLALVIYVILSRKRFEDFMHQHITIWILMLGIIKFWWVQMGRFCKRTSLAESPRPVSPPNTAE